MKELEKFEKYYRQWYQVCKDEQWFSPKGGKILRNLYASVPKSINFADFMDHFIERPTYNLEVSVSYMMDWLKEKLSA